MVALSAVVESEVMVYVVVCKSVLPEVPVVLVVLAVMVKRKLVICV